jgi:hypothetical protein
MYCSNAAASAGTTGNSLDNFGVEGCGPKKLSTIKTINNPPMNFRNRINDFSP